MSRIRGAAGLSIAHGCVDLYQGAVAALAAYFVIERGYTLAAAAGLLLAASVLASVAQPVLGWLADRRPSPWMLPLGTTLAGCGVGASGTVPGYPAVLACLAVAGLGVAMFHPEAARAARALSVSATGGTTSFVLGGNIGFACAPIAVALVVGTLGLAATPALAVPALVGVVLAVGAARRAERLPAPVTGTRRGGADVASFARLSVVAALRGIAYTSLSAFVAVFVQQRLGGGAVVGMVALVVLYVGGAVGTVVGGLLVRRWSRTRVCSWAYLVGAAAMLGLVVAPPAATSAVVAVIAVALYVPFAIQLTLGQDYLPGRVGVASGILLGLTMSVAGLFAPVVGALADATSLPTAVGSLAAVLFAACLLSTSLREPHVRS